LGESYYAFAARAWPDGFVAGWQVERAVLARTGPGKALLRNPYTVYVIGALGFLGLSAVIGGFFGLIWYLALVIFAQAQLLLSDYVQHYGLERHRLDPARLEPVGPQHSWNAPQWYSGAMMLNAPRHSDHHTHPGKSYPALTLGDDVPMLPRSLPVMGVIALYPPAWHRIMDKRAKAWRRKAKPQRAAA
jgi:alkane 1-monooxygenase